MSYASDLPAKRIYTDAALQRCSLEKVFWKYAPNLKENTHVKVQFRTSKSHFGVGVLL